VITGIHIGSYGRDIGSSLGVLVLRLVRAVPAARFRLSSIEATEIDESLVELLTDPSSGLVPHVHAPLQSGSDRLLRRMGRNWYSNKTYANAVERIASQTSVLGLGADVIAGFPGETDEDHADTVALVEALPFTYLHVFPFSLRPGTPAERMGEHVAPSEGSRRARELREVADRKASSYALARAGGVADVIAIGPAESVGREGLTEDYLAVRLADSTMPRGARFDARLTHDAGFLTAVACIPARGVDAPARRES
jgi:threonylcarbamoyladenosine tRNA methylthiotransferase MtaB